MCTQLKHLSDLLKKPLTLVLKNYQKLKRNGSKCKRNKTESQ